MNRNKQDKERRKEKQAQRKQEGYCSTCYCRIPVYPLKTCEECRKKDRLRYTFSRLRSEDESELTQLLKLEG